MIKLLILPLLVLTTFILPAQNPTSWSEADRKYLLANLVRSRDEVVAETKNLTEKQWRFKESPDRWSINEVVEHIDIWELLLMHEISGSIEAGPVLDRAAKPDSVSLNFIMEGKKHHSLDYTKPFSYTIPMGLDNGRNNVTKLQRLRNQSIEYVTTTKDNLRLYFRPYGNVHQTYIILFGHTDRHLRQIRKIKQHVNYPK